MYSHEAFHWFSISFPTAQELPFLFTSTVVKKMSIRNMIQRFPIFRLLIIALKVLSFPITSHRKQSILSKSAVSGPL